MDDFFLSPSLIFSYVLAKLVDSLCYLAFAWLFAEFCFYIIMKYAVNNSLQALKTPPKYDNCPVSIVMRILDTLEELESYTLEKFLSGWFCGASINKIRQNNIRGFVSWVMYASFWRDLTTEQAEKVDSIIDVISKRLNVVFEPGTNPYVKHVHMTLEPLHYLHRPLLLYVIIGIKDVFADISLQALGFQKLRYKTVSYWFRPPPTREELAPSVFFHGISTGWGSHMLLMKHLCSNRAIFLFDLDAVKIHSLCFEMPTPEYYCDVVKRVLDRHSSGKVNIIGHSFGTITAGWFVRTHPGYVAHLTLIDPVSLLLSHPEVAFNFLYRKPSTLMEWVIYLGAATEITIANTLRRNFWWYKNELWLEDVHHSIGVHVSLAGGDEVCNSNTVRDYVNLCSRKRCDLRNKLNSCSSNDKVADISHCFREGHSHAQVLICENSVMKMADRILEGQKRVCPKQLH
mmetsp:Transcript_2633/g.3950  ORF Transcript_2633/g.3950 Transcript_2633/m.3950 type:complete len:458 (+) Transcript_2633:101-1474(+)